MLFDFWVMASSVFVRKNYSYYSLNKLVFFSPLLRVFRSYNRRAFFCKNSHHEPQKLSTNVLKPTCDLFHNSLICRFSCRVAVCCTINIFLYFHKPGRLHPKIIFFFCLEMTKTNLLDPVNWNVFTLPSFVPLRHFNFIQLKVSQNHTSNLIKWRK